MSHTICIIRAVPSSEAVQSVVGSRSPVVIQRTSVNLLTMRGPIRTWLRESTTFCASEPVNLETDGRSSSVKRALRVGTRLVEDTSREMNSCHSVIEESGCQWESSRV